MIKGKQTQPPGRPDWAKVTAEFEVTEETQAEFCDRRGLGLGTFRYWLYRLRRQRRGAPIADQFVPLVASTATTMATNPAPLRLRTGDVELDFAELPRADYVAELLRLMDR